MLMMKALTANIVLPWKFMDFFCIGLLLMQKIKQYLKMMQMEEVA
jgi:hypothetical protein